MKMQLFPNPRFLDALKLKGTDPACRGLQYFDKYCAAGCATYCVNQDFSRQSKIHCLGSSKDRYCTIISEFHYTNPSKFERMKERFEDNLKSKLCEASNKVVPQSSERLQDVDKCQTDVVSKPSERLHDRKLKRLPDVGKCQSDVLLALTQAEPLQMMNLPVGSQVSSARSMKILIIGHTFVRQLFDSQKCFYVNADIVVDGFYLATVDQVLERIYCLQKNPTLFDLVIIHVGCIDLLIESVLPAEVAEKICNIAWHLQQICGVPKVVIQ